jgi:nucleoside-diphosphate-sugar epimerase
MPKLLIIGGTGFLSGTLAKEALSANWEVYTLTRGKRSASAVSAPRTTSLIADRKDHAALKAALTAPGVTFDLAVDCIAYDPADVTSITPILAPLCKHYVLVSTDFVYDPANRKFPQNETDAKYSPVPGYGANKRLCELALQNASLPWTVIRPCHIYGPGSLLGCSPPDNRDTKLIEKIKAGQPIPLVGASYLQQPIFAPDLARLLLSIHNNKNAVGQIFNAAGPDMVESTTYYKCVAQALGLPINIYPIDPIAYLAAHPDRAPFLCHRIYDLTRMKAAGLAVPSTPLGTGLKAHVDSLLG